jgi:hypothetical protein
MTPFESLPPEKKELLLKAPVYVSLLAANSNLETDLAKKKDAVDLVRIRTFSASGILHEFYKAADLVFLNNLEEINKLLPKEHNEREKIIRKELENLIPIVYLLGKEYAAEWNKSLESYARHVSRAHGSVLVGVMLPLYLKIFENDSLS